MSIEFTVKYLSPETITLIVNMPFINAKYSYFHHIYCNIHVGCKHLRGSIRRKEGVQGEKKHFLIPHNTEVHVLLAVVLSWTVLSSTSWSINIGTSVECHDVAVGRSVGRSDSTWSSPCIRVVLSVVAELEPGKKSKLYTYCNAEYHSDVEYSVGAHMHHTCCIIIIHHQNPHSGICTR